VEKPPPPNGGGSTLSFWLQQGGMMQIRGMTQARAEMKCDCASQRVAEVASSAGSIARIGRATASGRPGNRKSLVVTFTSRQPASGSARRNWPGVNAISSGSSLANRRPMRVPKIIAQ
jgi:hypothetical protein